MDPSIIKLLEDDEDENLHSRADVEAFTAALNRDLAGDASTAAVAPSVEPNAENVAKQVSPHTIEKSRDSDAVQSTPPDIEVTLDGSKRSDNEEKQSLLHVNGQVNNSVKQTHVIQPNMLLPTLRSTLDKDRYMQLEAVYKKVVSKEITIRDFLRLSKNIVGEQKLEWAVHQAMQAQTSVHCNGVQHLPQSAEVQLQDRNLLCNNGRRSPSHESEASVPLQKTQIATSSSFGQNFQQQGQGDVNKSNTKMVNAAHTNANGKPNTQLPQASLSTSCGVANNSSGNAFPGKPSVYAVNPVKLDNKGFHVERNPLTPDKAKGVTCVASSHPTRPLMLQKNSASQQQSVIIPKNGQSSNKMAVATLGRKEVVGQGTQLQKSHVAITRGSSLIAVGTSAKNQNLVPQAASQVQVCSHPRLQSTAQPLVSDPLKTPTKLSIGQKRPLESHCKPTMLASKKLKTSEAFVHESIEQLNDVTAVSGVNLREEEEQLFSAPKEDSSASEESRRALQEEEKLILQKGPLRKKIGEIISRSHLERASNNVENCLSVCVEERMRVLISNIIRLSKQRVDIEKTRHQNTITSDVRKQILMINQKAKEEFEKKNTLENVKVQNFNEGEGTADKDNNERKSKAPKTNKVEDDRMRTNAANVAARAAVGGDDMLFKWQLMAEQARLKREGFIDGSSNCEVAKSVNQRIETNLGRMREEELAERRGGPSAATSTGGMRGQERSQTIACHPRTTRRISTRDVIAVLEREPQMSRTPLLYRLYERL